MSRATLSPASVPATPTWPGTIKYGQSDVRNILERASARETAARVAAGSVAKHFLREFGIEVHSHIISIGGCGRTMSTPSIGRASSSPRSSALTRTPRPR